MKHEWPILLYHHVTLVGHTSYVNWHGGCHMVMLGHSRREWACLHYQVVALDLAAMQSLCWLVVLEHSKHTNGRIHTATWWW